ncbi:acyl-protein synthetase [Ponticoccus alexandrii]|uniref:Acyl-protein synthetase n=1 Tax=Ponticoccus alexandrii TaxID=1943633 RepID=A0ABX7FF38_9RHOB|nr:acyl-protein synthetase [Ponticoccus alexandrii]KID12310.1 acyl-protein synthetase [Rhodobacteraceae bacterium PD-2]QRF68684.1 acyl-protein synthetase [Ponticoccus alexandrii]
MTLDELFDQPVYSQPQKMKEAQLLSVLNDMDVRHRANCEPYAAMMAAQGKPKEAGALADLPFLPVRLFKSHLLESIKPEDRFKMLTSSGTTGQQVSRISLDRVTSGFQTKAVVKIMQDFLGKARMPMLVLDHPSVVKDRANFSARGAGILGMSNFGRKMTYALDDETMLPNWSVIDPFLEEFGEEPIFLFGFTFMVWKYFVRALEEAGRSVSIPKGILVHSGGWKKLQDEAVDNSTFKERTYAATKISKIHNFYGMVEQVGSIFVECEAGRLHAPSFADVIIRRPHDWSVADFGEEGLIQVLSCLPQSYPGHSLLTEDIGTLLGEDDCPCGRHGRTFAVHGRLPKAEVRGCSDTFDGQAA